MIVPFRHVSEFGKLTNDEASEIMWELQLAQSALTEIYKPHGFNIGMNIGKAAGAGFDGHMHVHVVPRREGDGLFRAGVVWARKRYAAGEAAQLAARLKEAMAAS